MSLMKENIIADQKVTFSYFHFNKMYILDVYSDDV